MALLVQDTLGGKRPTPALTECPCYGLKIPPSTAARGYRQLTHEPKARNLFYDHRTKLCWYEHSKTFKPNALFTAQPYLIKLLVCTESRREHLGMWQRGKKKSKIKEKIFYCKAAWAQKHWLHDRRVISIWCQMEVFKFSVSRLIENQIVSYCPPNLNFQLLFSF